MTGIKLPLPIRGGSKGAKYLCPTPPREVRGELNEVKWLVRPDCEAVGGGCNDWTNAINHLHPRTLCTPSLPNRQKGELCVAPLDLPARLALARARQARSTSLTLRLRCHVIGHPERSEGSSEQGSFHADSAGQDDMELYKLYRLYELYSITACSLWLSALLSQLCVAICFRGGIRVWSHGRGALDYHLRGDRFELGVLQY